MKLFRNIYSDWIKTKHTPIRLILFIVPIIYTSLIIWYSSTSTLKGSISYQEYIYFAFFELMAISFPLAEGLLCALVGIQEKNAGEFYNILSNASRVISYLSEFLMIVIMNIFVVFSSTLILILGMKFILHVENIHYILFFQGALLTILGSMFLIVIHLTLSLRFGIGASMAAGGAGFLIAALIGASNIGEKIWQYVPWTWPVKLPQLLELLMTNIGTKNGMTLLKYSRSQFLYCLPIIITFTAFVLFLNVTWFRRWEGKKSHE